MAEDLFFNKLVTKSMEAVHGGERFFEGYLTVQIKDKQGEITVVDELYKVLPVWMDRGAPISDTHSNRIIGKGINYSKTTYKDKDGEEYPAIKITGKIHKDYELDNEIWKKIKSGEYKGLSFGGATKSDRDPVRMKDGSIAYSLKDLEHYEVAVCADPAVPLALITDYNPVAKSATNAEVREDGKMIIKCDKFGCYITKPIPDGKGGKGDFDHCEEKNQDKNDPAAFCGAIQHKLEKAVEAGMLQQVVKNGLEIFLTKEELNKVCSACGKTLEEHGVVKYDHSNSMGDQHSMYNQNSGRETWIGQGLPQPTVEGKDDNPAEKDLTINADAMQNSSTKKGRTARNRKRRQAKQVKEGMAMFDTPNEVDKILSEAQTEVDAQEADTKRYNTGNPKAADMYKAFGFEDKKKDQADNIKEDSDNCPWCQKDPEGSGKPKWWRERANNWQKMLGSDNKRLGEWLSDHTFGTENRMQDTHDSDTEMHHTQSKQIPKEIEGAKEGMSAQAGANYDTMSAMGFPPTKEQSAEYEKRRNNSTKTHKSPNQSQNAKDHKCIGCGKQADTFALFGRRDRKTDTRNYLTDRESGKQVALPVCNSCGKELSAAAGERGVDIIPDPEGGHSKETQEELKSLESIIDKAEESNFGAGQRGLGYGNEGYTVVQGSGQNHTISEIPPEMEIIVHDINEIKESKKEGYTTEAGNSKRGDPSRATDDDDSLLSQTFVKNDPNWRSVNETVPKPKKDTPNPLDEDDDSLLAFPKEDSLDDGEVAPNM